MVVPTSLSAPTISCQKLLKHKLGVNFNDYKVTKTINRGIA